VRKAIIFILALFVLGFPGWVLEIEAHEPVVRILLFHSPACPHCEVVINDFLPGIQEKYGAQIEIRLLDISDPYKHRLLLALVETFDVQNDAALSEWLGEQYGMPKEKRLTTRSVSVGQDYIWLTLAPHQGNWLAWSAVTRGPSRC
jgi:hypothetical protein